MQHMMWALEHICVPPNRGWERFVNILGKMHPNTRIGNSTRACRMRINMSMRSRRWALGAHLGILPVEK